MKYYSPSTRGFYDPNEHGPRERAVADPDWVRPTVDLILRPGESGRDATGAIRTNETGADQIASAVPDWSAQPPMVFEPNPETKIPADAVEITDEEHARLLQEQSRGLIIQAGADGVPEAVPRTYTMEEMQAAVFPDVRRMREIILNRLTGIAIRALVATENDTVRAAAVLQQELLDITHAPAVLAITPEDGPDGLRSTILDLFREAATNAPAGLRSVFAELDP